MSEKKRSRRRKEGYTGPGEQETDKPSKDEYKVAKWMKSNLKTKKTKFLSHNVEYFTANKAVDALMKSKFATGDDAKFPTRDHVIEFLDIMLEHKFFHRAKKVPVSVDELRSNKSKSKEQQQVVTSGEKKDKDNGKQLKIQEKENVVDSSAPAAVAGISSDLVKSSTDVDENVQTTDGGCSSTVAAATDANGGQQQQQQLQQAKRKRKIRLDMHPEQIFVDGPEAYVWIYDPIPIHYWIYGLILLLGAIGICLFPLWPSTLRKGVYYLSVAAAGFLVFILTLTVIRLIIFTLVWFVTAGKLHFWILPNLTEDVGFFASFWPLYESKYVIDEKSKAERKSKSKSKKIKEKESDVDEPAAEVDVTSKASVPLKLERIEEIKESSEADAILLRRRKVATSGTTDDVATNSSGGENSDTQPEGSAGGDDSDAKCSRTPSESESEISGKDYEIISPSEVQNVQ